MRVGARPPFKDKICGFEGEKVQDGQIDVELVLFLCLHLPSEGEEACKWLALCVSTALDGLG